MLYTKNTSISHQHEHILHLLSFLESSPLALEFLATYHFGATQFQEGHARLSQAQIAYAQAQAQLCRQKAATTAFHQAWREVHSTYQVHLHGARRVLGPEAQRILAPAPGQYLNWLTHLRTFYKVILGNHAYQEKLRQRGILGEALLAAQQQLEQLPPLKNLQMQAAEARLLANQASQIQQQALHDWYRELSVVASVAFRHHPTLLASLRPALSRTKRTARSMATDKKAKAIAQSIAPSAS